MNKKHGFKISNPILFYSYIFFILYFAIFWNLFFEIGANLNNAYLKYFGVYVVFSAISLGFNLFIFYLIIKDSLQLENLLPYKFKNINLTLPNKELNLKQYYLTLLKKELLKSDNSTKNALIFTVCFLCFTGIGFIAYFALDNFLSSFDHKIINISIISILSFNLFFIIKYIIKSIHRKKIINNLVIEFSKFIEKQNIIIEAFNNKNLYQNNQYIAEYIADRNTLEMEVFAEYLDNKPHPAHKKAQEVRELKQKTKAYIKEYKLMRYEYDMLFSLFPELENYLEYYSTEKSETIEEVKENYDYVQSWISKEEYSSLDENTRNQLALDRYIESRKKSKWAIGRDYEMFIGHEYEQKGYKVTYTGITDRLEDKGRDLIAQKDNETLIIQCKNWSKYKEIHENHICQLFGTAVQYNIENNLLFKATPVFVTSATLSETALRFAEYLGVRVIQNKKLEEFPRIKCNINNKEKIYHLPFDQQYDKTIVGDQKGEFFAWTVQEAVDKGFRRAKKYFYVKQ